MKFILKNYWEQSKDEKKTEFGRVEIFFSFSFNLRRIILLEFSQYLENFLWPNLNPDQVKSMILFSSRN